MILAVQLSQEDWQRVLAAMSHAPWKDVNPLLMNIGEQLQKQIAIYKQSNSGEMPINTGETGVKQ